MNEGFTLLEVLIAALVLTITASALISAMNMGLFARSESESVATALNIAQARMEEIKNTTFGNINNSGPTPDNRFSAFNTEVMVSNNTYIKQVDVNVSWSTKGGRANISLSTFAANY